MSSTAAATTTKARKSTKKTEAAVAAPVAAPAPAPVVVAPVVAPVATPASTAAASPSKTEETVNVMAEFDNLSKAIEGLRSTLSTVSSEFKKLQKQTAREIKKATKGKRRRAAATTEGGEVKPKRDSVFTKPTKITDELAVFLGKPKGSEMVRGDVTKAIMQYVRDRKLNEKQTINADAPLRKLLVLGEKDPLTILNLQSYLKKHYIKPAAAVATA